MEYYNFLIADHIVPPSGATHIGDVQHFQPASGFQVNPYTAVT